jgi:hypothetical protein
VEKLLTELIDRKEVHLLAREAPIRVECIGSMSDSAPAIYLSRLTIGKLVDLHAAFHLALTLDEVSMRTATVEPPQIRVAFELTSRHSDDVDQISRELDLQATYAVRKGDWQPRVRRRSERTRWQFSLALHDAEDFDHDVGLMLKLLESRLDRVSSLTAHQFDGSLLLFAHFVSRVPTITLTYEQLRLVRRLGLDVGADLIRVAPRDV